jgi:hypothetical protein
MFHNDKLSANTRWNAGIRLGYTALNTPLLTTLFLPSIWHKATQHPQWSVAGITQNTSENVSLKANLSSGFRVLIMTTKDFRIGSRNYNCVKMQRETGETVTADWYCHSIRFKKSKI